MDNVILVTVNKQNLTREQAQQISREVIARQGVPPQMVDQYMEKGGEELEKQTVEQFINQALIKDEVERRQDPVSEGEITSAMAELERSLPEGITLDKAMASQGLSREAIEKDIINNERMRKLYEAETTDAPPVTAEEVSAFYEANTDKFKSEETAEARHILLACKAGDDPEVFQNAKAEAESIQKELLNGADFAQLAAEKSACPSGKEGGHLGRIRKGQMVPSFEQAAFTQAVDEIGPVVKTEFGYHVVQVTDRQDAGIIPKEKVENHIREHLTNVEKGKLFSTFINGLRENADIVYGDPTGGIIIP